MSKFCVAHRGLRKHFGLRKDGFLMGENAAYAEEMYEIWRRDPSKVHASWNVYFQNVEKGLDPRSAYVEPPFDGTPPLSVRAAQAVPAQAAGSSAGLQAGTAGFEKSFNLYRMVEQYRRRGHLLADLDPLSFPGNRLVHEDRFERLSQNPGAFGFRESELSTKVRLPLADGLFGQAPELSPEEVARRLEEVYCGKIGFEYLHIPEAEVVEWVRARIESRLPGKKSRAEAENLLHRVLESQALTDILHVKYGSSKRYGAEGCDGGVTGVEHLADIAKDHGVDKIVLGMPHRGRFNIMAGMFGKPLESIFDGFNDHGAEQDPKYLTEWGYSSDVKYHMSAFTKRVYPDGKEIRMNLLPNPSHLETVDPVLLGKARASQDLLSAGEGTRVLPIMIHGDGAFTGQGVVYETLQMEKLAGYGTCGTIHVVFNNQLAFTANPHDGRSSTYCSDVMKTTNALILHVNADHPEHVDYVFELAVEFRQKFRRDVIVDVVGFRRLGHNEHDSPRFTQPLLYDRVDQHPTLAKLYAQSLVKRGIFTQAEIDAKYQTIMQRVTKAYEVAKSGKFVEVERESETWKPYLGSYKECKNPAGRDTNISEETFKKIGTLINSVPAENNYHPIVQKVYEARLKSIETGTGVDWATAEALAFGTLLSQGFGVRLSGEDVKRGTFSHRHIGIVDQKNNQDFYPLSAASRSPNGPFRLQVYNSFLSEYGVFGFDYGYSIGNPNYLTIWEAQFGDFSNVAQPVIDTYLVNGEVKWGLKSGMVVLLPHGLDGQGPEHSSSKAERYLQMLDDDIYDPEFIKNDDMQSRLCSFSVCNITDPANYFHILRRQLLRDYKKPLIICAPKRLLRLKEVPVCYPRRNLISRLLPKPPNSGPSSPKPTPKISQTPHR